MTDIDFRRLASLLFALQLVGISQDPINDAIQYADMLLDKLQRTE
jgi:hypothetical protein